MQKFSNSKIQSRSGVLALLCVSISSCTQSVPGQFRLKEADQAFESGIEVSVVEHSAAPVDVLWVIDNSASMLPSQTKLRNGLDKFAQRFLRKGTDIQIGVITTDAYVANPLWEKFLATPHKNGKAPRDVNPKWNADAAKLSPEKLLRTQGRENLSALVSSFKRQVSVGTDGMPEERGFGSVTQFLSDNEASGSPSRLFRKGSHRIVVFLSDENDQTIDPSNEGPEPRKLLFGDAYYLGKDRAVADRKLPAHFTIDCPAQSVDGVELTPLSVCARPELLQTIDEFKLSLDQFFRSLDGAASDASPNYAVVSIVPKNLDTIQTLRGARGAGLYIQAERYLRLAELAGGGSFSMDIGIEDYTEVLNRIGLEVERHSRKFSAESKYRLERAVEPGERVRVRIRSGSQDRILDPTQFQAKGKELQITDPAVVSQLRKGDRIYVRYQPATVI